MDIHVPINASMYYRLALWSARWIRHKQLSHLSLYTTLVVIVFFFFSLDRVCLTEHPMQYLRPRRPLTGRRLPTTLLLANDASSTHRQVPSGQRLRLDQTPLPRLHCATHGPRSTPNDAFTGKRYVSALKSRSFCTFNALTPSTIPPVANH